MQYSSYLIHYGIEGQKWGVRRFQNEDGTYTDDGLVRRREQNVFIKDQKRIGKKFDKITEKISRDQAKGKNISKRRMEKAIDLGTKHRALDYISNNPRAYLKARALEKGSKVKAAYQIGATTALAGLDALAAHNGRVDSVIKVTPMVAAGYIQSISARRMEKLFINNWTQRQYGDIYKKCRKMTIKDLNAHGIKIKQAH